MFKTVRNTSIILLVAVLSITAYSIISPRTVYIVQEHNNVGTSSTQYLINKTMVDSVIPTYYNHNSELYDNYLPHDVASLVAAVKFINTLPDWNYNADTFNCYGMSICIEYILEQLGFNTVIACGMINGNTAHAWVIVILDGGEIIPIEATCRSIIYGDNSDYISYCNNGSLTSDIYELMVFNTDTNLNCYDWWNYYSLSPVEIVELAREYKEVG